MYEVLHKDFRKLGNLEQISEKLGIDAKIPPAGHLKGKNCSRKLQKTQLQRFARKT